MGEYEKKLIANTSEIQELHRLTKQLKLENEHLKGMNNKFQHEIEEKEKILDVSLSPTKKPEPKDLLTEDFFANDTHYVFFSL